MVLQRGSPPGPGPEGRPTLTAHSNSNANIFPASPPSLSGVTFATGWQYSGDTYTNNNVDGPVYLDLDTFSPAAQTVALQNNVSNVTVAAGNTLIVAGSPDGTTISPAGLEEVTGSDNQASIEDGGEQLISEGE